MIMPTGLNDLCALSFTSNNASICQNRIQAITQLYKHRMVITHTLQHSAHMHDRCLLIYLDTHKKLICLLCISFASQPTTKYGLLERCSREVIQSHCSHAADSQVVYCCVHCMHTSIQAGKPRNAATVYKVSVFKSDVNRQNRSPTVYKSHRQACGLLVY